MAKQGKTAAPKWRDLTWEHIEKWAGSSGLSKGRTYKSSVQELAISGAGVLLAWVQGTHRYATSVILTGHQPSGNCTCPVGSASCKHAIAVVLAYLDALKKDTAVPAAKDTDRRWAKIEEGPMESEDWYGGGRYDEDWDEDEGEDEEEDEPARTAKAGSLAYLDGMSQASLLALLKEIATNHPKVRKELEQRDPVAHGADADTLSEAQKLIRQLRGGNIDPDLGRLKTLLERLAGQRQADTVLDLGRDLADAGNEFLGDSEDEGEIAEELSACLDVVFAAVGDSPRPDAEKLLYVIDLWMQDEYDLCQNGGTVLDREWPAAAWSAVADELARRLDGMPQHTDFTTRYRRDNLTTFLVDALEASGREAEVLPLLEREAKLTHSYPRLVTALLEAKRVEDARRWIVEGIEATQSGSSGIASQLREQWQKLAAKDRDWASLAAQSAAKFFSRPSVVGLRDLLAAAKKAGCRETVEAAAMRFLETGERPKAGKPGAKSKTLAAWPLPPVPDFLAEKTWGPEPQGPQFSVLLDLALEAKDPDRVLRWYDEMQKAGKGRHFFGDRGSEVADAVAASHPDRAAAIYQRIAEGFVARTSPSAYESALPYFRKLKALWQKNGEAKKWAEYEAQLRQTHERKRRFLEVLDRVATKRVVDG